MIRSELSTAANELLTQLLVDHPMRRPQLEWRRYRTTAGTADFNRWTISLSYHVLDSVERMEVTLRHEYAHLLAVHRHGRSKGRGHGAAWQQAMRDLGLEPQVTHRYAVRRNQSRQEVIYFCATCGERFHRKRRLPVRRIYKHRTCGGVIRFLEIRACDVS